MHLETLEVIHIAYMEMLHVKIFILVSLNILQLILQRNYVNQSNVEGDREDCYFMWSNSSALFLVFSGFLKS
jgi:hypothetical protein